MSTASLRAGALVLAFALPITTHAAPATSLGVAMRREPPVFGPVPPPSAAPEPEPTPEPEPAPEPEATPTIADPTDSQAADVLEPAALEPVPPPAVIEPVATDVVDRDAIAAAEATRNIGATAMAVTGGFTVAGVVLILAGFGATAAAVSDGCAEANTCSTSDPKVKNAARVTLAGLLISALSAAGLVGGIITYGVGHARVTRARRGRFARFGVSPSQRGASVSLRGRF